MEASNLIGKKIINAKIKGIPTCDDEPYLILEFDDNSIVTIKASYGGYTGNSEDEYPAFISIEEGEL